MITNKHLILAIIVGIIFLTALSIIKNPKENTSKSKQTFTQNELFELCTAMRTAAGATMRSRQLGIPKETLKGLAVQQPDIASMVNSMVEMAYDRPVATSEMQKQRMVKQFEQEAFVTCMEYFGNN